jgi:hypothetical protein
MIRVAAHDGMILELAEATCERDVLGARDVLVAQEQHAVLEQQRPDLGEQRVVARRVAEIDVEELGTDVARELLGSHGLERARAYVRRRAGRRFT